MLIRLANIDHNAFKQFVMRNNLCEGLGLPRVVCEGSIRDLGVVREFGHS